MPQIEWNRFQQPLSVESVAMATLALGELSRWWLNDRARQVAAELDQSDYWIQKPILQSRIGACWIVVVNPDIRTHALLQPAFLLPLIWVRQTEHSATLPASLRRLADDVIETWKKHGGIENGEWGLQLCLESDASLSATSDSPNPGPDFSSLPDELFDFRSGWVSLAGTLLAASRDVATNPLVWATGCWEADAGVIEVGGLEHKLRLADEYFSDTGGGRRIETWFMVPSANLIEANRLAAQSRSRFTPVAIPAAQRNPGLALSGYLALLRVRPPEGSPVEAHVAYYKSILADDQQLAENYYQTVLYPLVVRNCRERMGSVDPKPTHLVTVVSPNNELVRLAVEVFQIKECLLLYTVPGEQSAYTRQILDMSKPAQQAAQQCASVGCKTHLVPFTYDASRPQFREELSQTIRELVEPHLEHIVPQHVAFDMHSAHKIFNYVFDHAVARPGNLMYWIDHLWFPAFRTQHPLTERFVVWRAGTSWTKEDRAPEELG